MTSFSSWNGVKLSAHRGLVTDVLKGRMNFDGLVITDWNVRPGRRVQQRQLLMEVVDAGIDMFMAPDSWRMLYDSTLAQVRDGTIAMERLDDAVARVLRLKERLGLFGHGQALTARAVGRIRLARRARSPCGRARGGAQIDGAAQEHRRVAAAAGRADPRRGRCGARHRAPVGRVDAELAGHRARQQPVPRRDIAMGRGSRWRPPPAVAAPNSLPEGSFTERPDAAIVVFGETPYAEFQGDIALLQLRPELRRPIATMQRLKQQGIPVVRDDHGPPALCQQRCSMRRMPSSPRGCRGPRAAAWPTCCLPQRWRAGA